MHVIDHTYGNSDGRIQRFRQGRRCPVCGGQDLDPRGVGRRCMGFLSSDGDYIHCSREEYAGGLEQETAGTYAHKAHGACRCGMAHGAPLAQEPTTIAATYDYRAADGSLLFQVVRREPKSFRQRRPDGQGGWAWNLHGIEPVLYRLPELLAERERVVFLVEGEKDANALGRLGLVATTAAMGAGKWRPSYTDALRGRGVVLIGDSDVPGRRHAEQVAAQLAGVARWVRIIDLAPDKDDGYDVSDWLAEGHTRAELEAIAADAPPLAPAATKPTQQQQPPAPAFDWRQHVRPLRELMTRHFEPATFVIPGAVPSGTTLIAGAPKTGKSLLGWQIALAKALGGKALGKVDVARADVLYLLLEDGERLAQKRVGRMLRQTPVPENFDYSTVWAPLMEGGVEALRDYLAAKPATRLVVVDTFEPLRAADRPGQNAYRNDYQGLRPLTQLAHETGVDIIVVHHTAKMERSDVFATVNGSYGLNGAVDNVAVLTRVRFGTEVVLSVSGRDLDEDLQLALQYDPLTCSHTLLGDAEEVGRSRLERLVIGVLRRAKEALQARDIADELGKPNDSNLRHILGKLVRDGLAKVVARGRYTAAAKPKQELAADVTCEDVIDVNYEEPIPVRPGAWEPEAEEEGPAEELAGVEIHIDHNDHKLPATITAADVLARQFPTEERPSGPCFSCHRSAWTRFNPSGPEALPWYCSNCGSPADGV